MWIKTQAMFKDDMSSVEWDLLSEEDKYASSHPNDFRFDTDLLACYNRSSIDERTTIVLRDYGAIMICMTVEELDKIIFP